MATVYVCHGKDCVRSKHFASLCKAVGTYERVPCQKVCKGPVAGTEINGRLQWFKALKSAKHVRALLKAAATGKAPKKLWERRKKKRAGKLRGRAAA